MSKAASREASVDVKEGTSFTVGEGSGSNSRDSPATPRTPKPKQPQVRGVSVFLAEAGGLAEGVTAAELLVYEWPPSSGDRWFLQEQLCEFLGIKSFKRRYPDVQQRAIRDPHERDLLREAKVVSETAMELGLTGLREAEVTEAMRADYPEKWKEYEVVLAARTKAALENAHQELVSIAKDSGRLAELRRKAVTNAASWNQETNEAKRRERKAFWDIQTNQVQRPRKRPLVLDPEARPQWGDYPVPLIQGQFGNFYKSYTSEELSRLPLRSVTDGRDYAPVRRRPSPPPVGVSDSEIRAMELAQAKADKVARNPDIAAARGKVKNETGSDDESLVDKECAFCSEELREGDRFVECASCASCGHPSCLEMTDAMVRMVRGYPWMCMECKPCSLCSKLDQEDKMLFCDLCDRGYHTFCVGLQEPPYGLWVCQMFCKGQALPKDGMPAGGRRSADSSGRGSSLGQEPNAPKCKECHVRIHKGNKVHHRSRFRDAGICNYCVQKKGPA